MAQSYTTVDGITLIDPGTVVSTTVQAGTGNTASAGVVTIIGEADQGPGFMDEADLSQNQFTPSQLGKVIAKYGSGRLVDAFSKVISAANDPNIIGGVSLVRLVKTNMSQSAEGSLLMRYNGSPAYADGMATMQGAPGNLIQYKSDAAVAELAPNTGLFDYAPALAGTILFSLRANGGPKLNVTVTAKMAPDALVSALEDVAKGILPNGGHQKLVAPAAALTLSAAPIDANTLLVTLQAGSLWANAPAQGDVAVIPDNGDYGSAQVSCIAGTAHANAGTYIVQSVTNSVTSATMTLKRVSSDAALVSASGSIHTDLTDLINYGQIQIQNVSGDNRQFMLSVFGTYNVLLNNGSQVQIQTPSATFWNVLPQAGDILKIPAMFSTINAGFYQVTASSSNTVTAVRLSEGSSGSGAGTQAYSSGAEPMQLLAAVLSGQGKTLSFEGTVSSIFLAPDGSDEGLSNARLVSAAEYRNQLTIIKNNQSRALQAGGDIIIEIGCDQELATVNVQADHIDFAVNAVIQFSITYKQFSTVSDLAAYINSQTNWSADVPLAKFNTAAPAQLDEGTYSASSALPGVMNLRLKRDAYDWQKNVSAGSPVAWTVDRPGLPEPTPKFQFLSGGAKNGTTSAAVVAAIDACQKLTTNFMVPTFSADADVDIESGDTESSSTYTISAINAYLETHVNLMSQLEMKANRIGVGSLLGSFAEAVQQAGMLADFRIGLTFEPIQGQNSAGQPVLFQPWMAAVVAVGMSAAAGYKGIVKKFANVSGLGSVDGFDSTDPGSRKLALQAGLLFMEKVSTGGIRWVSDQTTYAADNNFVYNSLQAVYVSDLITLSLIDRFDRSAAGKSVADITATAALSIFEAEMFNYKRLKWIAASDDAPKGYKNASATIDGPALVISAEIKLAGLIYFIPISLLASQVTQTATQ